MQAILYANDKEINPADRWLSFFQSFAGSR